MNLFSTILRSIVIFLLTGPVVVPFVTAFRFNDPFGSFSAIILSPWAFLIGWQIGLFAGISFGLMHYYAIRLFPQLYPLSRRSWLLLGLLCGFLTSLVVIARLSVFEEDIWQYFFAVALAPCLISGWLFSVFSKPIPLPAEEISLGAKFGLAAFVIATVTFDMLSHPLSSPTVDRTIPSAQGFDLEYGNVDMQTSPILEIGYVIGMGYPYFTYEGRNYESAGAGGVTIREAPQGMRSPYLVRETFEPNEWNPFWPLKTTLTITDQVSGEIIAKRIWFRKNRSSLSVFPKIENGNGWVGEHAAAFVQKVLVPVNTTSGTARIRSYPKATGTVVDLPAEGTLQDISNVQQCPNEFAIGDGMLNTSAWRFKPKYHVHSAVCTGDSIIVFSTMLSNELYIDALSLSGKFIEQHELGMPISALDPAHDNIRLHNVRNLSLVQDKLRFEVIYSRTENIRGRAVWVPFQVKQVELAVKSIGKRA